MPRRITPTHWRIHEKIFLADGFTLGREESSHRSYVKPGILRPVVIPKYREVPVSIIRNNMTTANMSRERYLELLNKVKKSLESDYPRPKAGAFRPIHGCATAISKSSGRGLHPLPCIIPARIHPRPKDGAFCGVS